MSIAAYGIGDVVSKFSNSRCLVRNSGMANLGIGEFRDSGFKKGIWDEVFQVRGIAVVAKGKSVIDI
jgi:hypothetical protein